MAPGSVLPGDATALVHGESLPIILCPEAEGYTFRGFACVHGIMKDELLEHSPDIRLEQRNFLLR